MSTVRRATVRAMSGLVVLLTSAACTDEPASSAVSQRDSAGVAIVESTSPRWGAGEGWSVDPAPVVDLATSGTGPPHKFFGVSDAMRLPDGSIAVADSRSGEIRFFSATGEFLRAVGRRGEGPGEFGRLNALDRFRGDSIVAFDGRLGRVTVLDPSGAVARVVSLRLPLVRDLRPLGDSTFVGRVSSAAAMSPEQGNGLYRNPLPVVRFSAAGEVVDTVATSAGAEEFRMIRGADWLSVRPLFGKAAQLAIHDGRIYRGSADRMRFEVLSADGELERIVRVPGFDLRLSTEVVEAERAAMLGPDPPPMKREVFDALPTPDTRPAFSDLLVDPEGFVWAAEAKGWSERDRSSSWNVFDPDGAWLGAVQIPGRFTVFEIGANYVLGLYHDELDVEHVQLLRLRRD